MIITVVTFIVVAALLLMLIVLAQDPKSGGFASGVASGQLMGVQKTTDLLEKITWGLGIAIFVLAISTNFLVERGEVQEGVNSVNINRARETNAVQPAQPGQQPAAQPQGQAVPAGTQQPAAQPTQQPQPEPAPTK